MKGLTEARVAIVGLGLMGGSLAGALCGKCRAVIGVARREETLRTALAQGLVDHGTTDLSTGIHQADVVILATPVRVVMQLLTEIGPLLPEGSLLMDLGSTKVPIVAEMARLPEHVQPLGGHPMCGKEVSGIAEADPALYRGCTFILTPLPRTSRAALDLGRELTEAIGAHPLLLEPGRQDYLVGTISHLPYLLACALIATADVTTSNDPAAWEVVANGFRDTTRVAGSDTTMMIDVLLTNRDEILKALRVYQAKLRDLTRLVDTGDEEPIRASLNSVREQRRAMFP